MLSFNLCVFNISYLCGVSIKGCPFCFTVNILTIKFIFISLQSKFYVI